MPLNGSETSLALATSHPATLTSEALPKSRRPISRATHNVTSSPASVDGPSLFDALGGPTSSPSGQSVAPALHGPEDASGTPKERAQKIIVTSGLPSCRSSSKFAPSESSENRSPAKKLNLGLDGLRSTSSG